MSNRKFVSSAIFLLLILSFAFTGGQRTTEPDPVQASPHISEVPNREPLPSTPPNQTAVSETPEFKAADRWKIGIHPYDSEVLNSEISEQIAADLWPVGLQVLTGNSVMVLYSKVIESDKTWGFVRISSLDQVNTRLTELLQEGWLPLDFSLSSTDMHVISSRSPNPVESWRVMSLSYDSTDTPRSILAKIDQVVRSQLQEKRILFGVAAVGTTLYLLFIETQGLLATQELSIGLYPNDGSTAFLALDQKVFEGAVPAGYAYTDEWILIPYYK